MGGAQLSCGYLNRESLTKEKFIQNPFDNDLTSMLYRTGDLARWRNDGTLEYLGRIDTQVKIRGMRVELEEIESAIERDAQVHQAIVSIDHQYGADGELTAYIVLESAHDDLETYRSVEVIDLAEQLDIDHLRTSLSSELPSHMVPTHYIGLNHAPLTDTGKINRRLLPQVEGIRIQHKYIAPNNRIEKLVANIFSEILAVNVSLIGLNDNFFDLGGHSLHAMKLVAKLEKATGLTVTMKMVFEYPTVGLLALAIENQEGVDYDPFIRFNKQEQPEIGHVKALPVLYCVHAGSGHATIYKRLIPYLGDQFEIVGVQARGWGQHEKVFNDYEELLNTYTQRIQEDIESRLETLPFILGWSTGGNIAHTVASRLAINNCYVEGLIILDSFHDEYLDQSPKIKQRTRRGLMHGLTEQHSNLHRNLKTKSSRQKPELNGLI